jgi:hypothetical protein
LFLFYKNLLEKIKNKEFMKKVRELKPDNYGIDQTIISHFIAQEYNPNIKLDYNCKIFYTACCDWFDIDNYVDHNLRIKETNSYPCVFHVPWKKKWEHILMKLFLMKYKNKMRIYV